MGDKNFLVLSALGSDRPGLVAEVTAYLAARSANLEDSRMAILGAEFGILVLVSGTADALARVAAETKELEQKSGLSVLTRATKNPADHRAPDTRPFTVIADALDHEGIVHAVAAALHRSGVNVASLGTSTYAAPVTGALLFRLEATIDAPPGVGLSELRRTLDGVARDENIDIDVRAGTR